MYMYAFLFCRLIYQSAIVESVMDISLHGVVVKLLAFNPGVLGSIPGLSSISDETLNRGPMTIFQDKLLTRLETTLCISPRDLHRTYTVPPPSPNIY